MYIIRRRKLPIYYGGYTTHQSGWVEVATAENNFQLNAIMCSRVAKTFGWYKCFRDIEFMVINRVCDTVVCAKLCELHLVVPGLDCLENM